MLTALDWVILSQLMDWKTFVDHLTGSIVWPAVVVIFFVTFRSRIGILFDVLLSRPLRSLKAGPVELLWDATAEEAKADAVPIVIAEAAAAAASQHSSTDRSAERDFVDEMMSLAKVAPSAAVLESYKRLELLLAEFVSLARIEKPRTPVYGRRLVTIAANGELLNESETSLFYDLVALRNVAAHEDKVIDLKRAEDFVTLAAVLHEALTRRVEGENWDPPDR